MTSPCSPAARSPDDIATSNKRPRSLTWLHGVCKRRAWGPPWHEDAPTWAISSTKEGDENKTKTGLERRFSCKNSLSQHLPKCRTLHEFSPDAQQPPRGQPAGPQPQRVAPPGHLAGGAAAVPQQGCKWQCLQSNKSIEKQSERLPSRTYRNGAAGWERGTPERWEMCPPGWWRPVRPLRVPPPAEDAEDEVGRESPQGGVNGLMGGCGARRHGGLLVDGESRLGWCAGCRKGQSKLFFI